MIDFKKLPKFSFKDESVWMIIFGLLPLVLGIFIYLVVLLLSAFKIVNFIEGFLR